MPPRRRTAPPPIDVQDLRSRLDQGKIVRVAIAPSAQFPQGSVGRVRRIGDPEIDGEEFIYVELTVSGTKDLLPFAPADLTAPTRAAPARAAASGAAPGVGAVTTRVTNGAVTDPNLPTANVPGPVVPAASLPAADALSDAGPGAVDAPARPKAVRPKPAGRRRGPTVTITIGTTDADPPQWRIEAKVGSKVVLRSGSVPPARVWELVGTLRDEALTRAVGTVLDEQRQAAQARADTLAAELAKVQAELAELPAPEGG